MIVRFVKIDRLSPMPKLKPATQAARREHILDAAEICFAHNGFHRTTMQDICREAELSPGAFYLYFASKEDLIAGIVERERAEISEMFAALAEAEDFLAALHELGVHYLVERPDHKHRIFVEIGLESTRNEKVGKLFTDSDRFCREQFTQLFARLIREGRIAPAVDLTTLVDVFMAIGDGMFWRRAVTDDFDAARVLPVVLVMVGQLINPVVAQPARPPLTETA